jgi:hypothetical protein
VPASSHRNPRNHRSANPKITQDMIVAKSGFKHSLTCQHVLVTADLAVAEKTGDPISQAKRSASRRVMLPECLQNLIFPGLRAS